MGKLEHTLWVEKYRPDLLESYIGNEHLKSKIKLYLESISKTEFVRMTGSGSALVAYYQSKASCHKAKKMFKKKYMLYIRVRIKANGTKIIE